MLEPWVSASIWGKVIDAVPNIIYIIILCLVFFLAMLKDYAYTTFEDVSVSIFASVAVPFGFSIFIRLRDMYVDDQFGAQLMGMAFGKHKMAPNISPKKTVEGAFGGLIFSMVLNAVALTLYNKLAVNVIPQNMATLLLAMVLPTSFMGMMGDLSASVLKRNFEVKDFGKIFPGHGGVMDRMDSSLFTLPVTYAIALIASKIF